MPIALGALYVVGLYGLVALAFTAGKKKSERTTIQGDVFGWDPKSKAWWIFLIRNRRTGRYEWTVPIWADFFERGDAWFAINFDRYERVNQFTWNGKQWIPDEPTIDPRYGQTRVASR